jgi:hypothetical protein
MERINLNFAYLVGESFGRLTTKNEFSIEDLKQAEVALWYLYRQEMYDIKPAEERIIELYKLIQIHIEKYKDCKESHKIDDADAETIKTKAEECKISITSCFSAQPTNGYLILMYNPQDMFPKNLIDKIPGVEQDVSVFGKAFACEMPASCCILLFTIFKVALEEFGAHLEKSQEDNKNQKHKKQESENQESQDDEIKEIKIKVTKEVIYKYRNKLMHREINLKNMEEVIKIFNAVNNALYLILKDMPMVKNSTVNDTNNCEK